MTGLYFFCDPYKTLRPFSLTYFDTTNRDYLSSELFLLNYPREEYDSYIFASSRGCGINSYHWKKYLPAGSKQFVFQAWSETLLGIDQKITYIDNHDYCLKNALVLLDVPDVFDENQVRTETISIKDPVISGQPRWIHQMILLYNFAQKPSQWIRAIRETVHPSLIEPEFDTITNDWIKDNCNKDLSIPPAKDSLNSMSALTKAVFMNTISEAADTVRISKPLISKEQREKLEHIKSVFDKQGTSYKIVIAPGYYQTGVQISPVDLECLQSIFGAENVYDFSGKNALTSDYNNFSDPSHFGLFVGWYIIENIYAGRSLEDIGDN